MTVVFPAPLPPKRASVSLGEMSNDTFSTAKSFPKYLVLRETYRIGARVAGAFAELEVFSVATGVFG